MTHLMTQKQIRDFNRCFEPNAFNTGPPIPKVAPTPGAPYAATVALPDLSVSPASSTSSLSLTLEDDEIKKIFSDPKFDPPLQANVKYSQLSGWSNTTSSKDELNPKAAPFVPSFLMSADLHNPQAPYQPQLPTLAPLYPPGLPHPPSVARKLSTIQESELETKAEEPVAPLPPAYLPVLVDALKPTATARDRQVLLRFILQYVEQWDMINLLELADRICIAAFGSQTDSCQQEDDVSACDPIRRSDCGSELAATPRIVSESTKPEETVALVVEELYKQFFEMHGTEVANSFVWDVRELVLRRFICSFDATIPDSITSYAETHSEAPLPSAYVRSSLSLCKSIASLYQRNLIMREHISMCISILLKDLKSVEHVEALAFLVTGCGMKFWDPPCPPMATKGGDEQQHAIALKVMGEQLQRELHVHVKEFLAGLEANLTTRALDDHASLLGQPWGSGRLVERVKEVVVAVTEWEATLVGALLQVQVQPTAVVAASA